MPSANRLKPLNYVDFTGGVNLRPETFQLLENELPELLNLEVDPRGGLNTRKSWKVAVNVPVTASPWEPHTAYLSRHVDSSQHIYVTNNHRLHHWNGATWDDLTGSCNAVPHEVDFASWDDHLYVQKGWQVDAVKVRHTTVTPLTACASANWQNDYTAPGGTDTMPRAELNGQHAGYLFVANTGEDGVHYPNRIRWSHPNNPQRWAKDDYIDIHEGGAQITAITPFSDRLVVFKPDSVWAVFGYSAETWEVANISRTIGALNAQLVCRNENAVFFLSWPHGIFQYTDKDTNEISVQIRAVFSEEKMDPLALDTAYLGWVERRLWCSLPYSGRPGDTPDEPFTTFVFDPVLGSWTMFRGADNCVPGPFIERSEMDTYESEVAVLFQKPYAVALDAQTGKAIDMCEPGFEEPFETRLRTKWLDAGHPTWRKSWRRPDFLLRALTLESTLNVQVFHNYDYGSAQRSFVVAYSPEEPAALYGDFVWGDGTKYGGSQQSSSVERGGTMGRAGTVQLLMTGFPTVQWGLNGIVFKFISRRFR